MLTFVSAVLKTDKYGNPIGMKHELTDLTTAFDLFISGKPVSDKLTMQVRDGFYHLYGLNLDNPIIPELWMQICADREENKAKTTNSLNSTLKKL